MSALSRVTSVLRGFRPSPPVADPDDSLLDRLGQPYAAIARSLYRSEPQMGTDGSNYSIDAKTGVTQEQGIWIYDLCLKIQPKATLEIGMAYGFSTVFFLAANAQTGATHTAVDPFQRSRWRGIGLSNAARTGNQVELVEELSSRAAGKFVEANRQFDVILIDGNHRFDDLLVDFTLLAPVCRMGGYIICDDLWMRSIRTAVSFISKNRTDFETVPTPIDRIAVFRKTGDDQRNWDHFEPFAVTR